MSSAPKDLLGLARLVRRPAIGDGHRRQDHAFLVAQGDILADLDTFSEFLGHVEIDRHRPERAVGQAHGVDDALVILLGQEALQRVEPAVHQQFQVADLARGQIPALQIGGLDFQLLRRFGRDIEFGNGGEIGSFHDATVHFNNSP